LLETDGTFTPKHGDAKAVEKDMTTSIDVLTQQP